MSEKPAFSEVAIFGSATFTIVMSSSSMNVPTQTTSRVHHFRSMGLDPRSGLQQQLPGGLPPHQVLVRLARLLEPIDGADPHLHRIDCDQLKQRRGPVAPQLGGARVGAQDRPLDI